jgi:hypothetical protein
MIIAAAMLHADGKIHVRFFCAVACCVMSRIRRAFGVGMLAGKSRRQRHSADQHDYSRI